MPWPRQRWAPYVAALLLICVIGSIRLAIHDLLPSSAVGLLFTPAILAAAMLGGLAPGLFATLIASPVVYYFIWTRSDPVDSTVLNMLLFLVVGATIAWLGGLLIALGGVLSLIGRVAGDLRRRTAKRKIAIRHAEMAR